MAAISQRHAGCFLPLEGQGWRTRNTAAQKMSADHQSNSNEDEFLLDALKDKSAILCEYWKFGKSKGPPDRKQLKHETAESRSADKDFSLFPKGQELVIG